MGANQYTHRGEKKLIIEVEMDQLRLPIRICESYTEMAQATGCTNQQIRNSCYGTRAGKYQGRFEMVYIEDDA